MLLSFLLAVVDLFDGVFNAIMAVSVLGFFMTSAIFFCVIALFAWLVYLGRTRKL